MPSWERTDTARGFASGMAAIAAAVIPFLKCGDRIVAVRNLYSDAFRLFEDVLAWLILRGMRTLRLRMRQHMENGIHLARALEDEQAVERVRHPAREAGPSVWDLTEFGGVFAVDLDDAIVPQLVDALEVFRIGVTWGGPESLVVPACAALELAGPNNVFRRFDVGPRTVRLVVGLEDAPGLVADVRQALAQAAIQ